MPALYLVTPRASGGGQISAADINQLVNTLNGNQNTPVSIKNTDPIAYTLQLQNTDAAGKALLIYGPDGTTVLNRVQGNGVVASPDGTAAATIVTTTHAQTLTGKTFTAPHMTSPVVDSGGLTVTLGGITVAGGGSWTGTLINSGVLQIGAGTVAAGGPVRFSNNATLTFRDASNTSDISLGIGTSNELILNGVGNSATVGAAGGGSAPPATPVGYFRMQINSTVYKVPFYTNA